MAKFFEVLFRGEKESTLQAWTPSANARYGCTALEARERYDYLVTCGLQGVAVDGVVPFVIEIRKVRRVFVAPDHDQITYKTMLWQYAEPDAVEMGPWAEQSRAEPFPLVHEDSVMA